MNNIKTAALLGLLTGLFVMIGQAIGGQGGLIIGFMFAIVMNFGSWFMGDKLILKMYGAKLVGPADAPHLYKMVEKLAQKANMPMPKVALMENPVPNAFATGRNPNNATVAATTGLLNMLSYDEIEGVMAHELSHVRHRDTLISAVAATLAGAIMVVANMAQWAAIFGIGRSDDDGPSPLALLLTVVVAPIAATLIQFAISRSREYLADSGAASITGNPQALASALAKISGVKIEPGQYGFTPQTAHLMISNPFKGGMMNMFSTHPPTEERIKHLMMQPV